MTLLILLLLLPATAAAAPEQAEQAELSPLLRVIGTGLVFGGLAMALPVVVESAERGGPDESPELLGPGIAAGVLVAGGIPLWVVGGLPGSGAGEPAAGAGLVIGPTGGWLRLSF